jgi:hypothetical protein
MWWRGVLGVVCVPHCGAEWALRLLEEEGQGFTLLLTAARSQISRTRGTEVPVDRIETSVPTDLAAAVREVWATMLARTRHQTEPFGISGYDGPVYHFTCKGGPGMLSGYSLRLDQEKAPGRLIALAESLAGLAEATSEARPKGLADVWTRVNWFRSLHEPD